MTAGSPREQAKEPTAGNLVGLKSDVDSKKTLCGGNGLVAMELGYNYADSGSILTIAKSLVQMRVQQIQPKRLSGTLFTRTSC